MSYLALALILAGNLVTIATAMSEKWAGILLLWPFLWHSLAIGFFNARRMRAAESFTTADFRFGSGDVPADAGGRKQLLGFFVFAYGLVHVLLLAFLCFLTRKAWDAGLPLDDLLLAQAFGLFFFVSEAMNAKAQREADRGRVVHLGYMSLLPHLRVAPLYAALFGGLVETTTGARIVAFGAFKLFVDLATAVIEARAISPAGAKKKTPA